MARVDDYQKSFDLAAEDAGYLEMSCLGRPVRVGAPPITVTALDDGPEVPLAEQALVLHYLVKADGAPPSGEWITCREVEFYRSAFVKKAKAPLVGGEGPGTRSSRPRATCSLTATSATTSPPRTSPSPPGCPPTR